jgi:hypothetical protein
LTHNRSFHVGFKGHSAWRQNPPSNSRLFFGGTCLFLE